MSTVIVFTSGKEGVGKTTLASNIGIALIAQNARVCILNADTGFSCVQQQLGINPPLYTLNNVLNGQKTMDQITLEHETGLTVVPVGSGFSQSTALNDEKTALLISALQWLEKKFDYILIDTVAGSNNNTQHFISAAQYKIIVITSEPRSLSASFNLLRQLKAEGNNESIFVLVNKVDGYQSSQTVFKCFQLTVKKYLSIDVEYLGFVPGDSCVDRAFNQQRPVVLSNPDASVSCSLASLADIIKTQFINNQNTATFSRYWEKHLQPVKKVQPKKHQLSALKSLLKHSPRSEEQLKNLILSLEILYEKKHNQTIRDLNSSIALILAEGDENRMQHLHSAIERSYERQFEKKIHNPFDTVSNLVNDKRFTKNDFTHLLENFASLYYKRFNEKFFPEGNTLLTQIQHLISNQNLKKL